MFARKLILPFWNVSSTFRNAQSLAKSMKRLNFTVLKYIVKSWFDYQIIRNFDILKCLLQGSTFEMFNRLLTPSGKLIFHGTKMFVRKLILQSNFRIFDILKCLLYDSTFEMFNRLLTSWNAYISTVLKCLIECWFDYQISEIWTFWNVCYKTQVWRCSIAFLRPETLIFHCSKMFCEKLIWPSNIRYFDILKCLML